MADQLEPFVGPRPFEREDEKYFFGRDQAAQELVSLILAYPVVILYAQSGAGKTSLLKAKVLSVLEDKKGFDVPPIARVRSQGTNVDDVKTANVYVANALRDLSDNSLSAERRAQLTLAQYLAERPRPRPSSEFDDEEDEQEGQVQPAVSCPRVLIFDQFEELFTLYPERYNDRKNFFEQLRDALEQDSLLRVVFSMREDYIAELDPYVYVLPDSLRTRFRLERLRKQPAVQAVLGPLSCFNEQVAADQRIQISKEVAESLVDNLRTIKVHSAAGEAEFEGEFIEPVHLQIVCKALLEKMVAEGKSDITDRELEEFGNLNQALAEYFERAIAKASREGGVDEGRLRRWFNDVLITPDNTRSTVLRGRNETAGISNNAIDVLANERLIRSETRDNREWYELSHDKLMEPIRLSFQQWLLKQSGAEQMRLGFIERAGKWLASHRTNNSLLLTATEIASAKRWTNHEADGYNESLAALVDASQAALDRVEQGRERALALERQRRAEAEAEIQREKAAAEQFRAEQAATFAAHQTRSARRLRFMVFGLVVMLSLSIAMSVYAVRQRSLAINERNLNAEFQQKVSEERAQQALHAQRLAEEGLMRANELQRDADEQRHKAEEKAEDAKLAEKKAAAAAVAEKKASAEAKLQKTLAISSTAAARAELMIAEQPNQVDNSVKRALASLALNPESVEGEQALRHGMNLLPLLSRQIEIDLPAQQVAFTPNGDISTFNSGLTKLYSTDGKEKNSVIHSSLGEYTVNSDDGRFIATISFNGEAKIINVTDPQGKPETISLIKPGENADDLWHGTFSADGKFFACVVAKQLRVWEVATKRLAMNVPIVPLNPEQVPTVFKFSQTGLFIGARDQEGVSIYRVEGGEKVFTAPEPRFGRATYTLGTNYLAVGTNDTEKGALVSVLDLRDNSSLSQWLTSSLIDDAVLSPDETKLATTIGSQVTVWDTKSGREFRRVGHSSDVKSVGFGPKSDLLATVGEDRTTRIWELRTGRELFRMGHEGIVNSVSFSQDGKYLVTAGNKVRLWDISRIANGLNLYQDSRVAQVVFSHKGAYVAVVTSKPNRGPSPFWPKNIKIFDALTGGELVDLGRDGAVLGVSFSVDDELLLIADLRGRSIEARRVNNGKVEKEYSLDGPIDNIEFSANGRYAVAGVFDKGVRLLDLSGKEPIRDLPFSESGLQTQGTGTVSITHDGARVFYQDRKGHTFGWDKNSGSVFSIDQGIRAETQIIKPSPDSRYLAYQPQRTSWRIWDVAESKPILDQRTEDALRAVNFSNDGRYAALVFRDNNKIQVYDLQSHTSVLEVFSESLSTRTTFSDDSKYLASGGGGLVQVWSTTTRNEVARIELGGSLNALDFSPDGKYVMTGSTDRTVRLTLLRTSDLIDSACKRTGGLTVEEWLQYFGDEPYRPICPSPK